MKDRRGYLAVNVGVWFLVAVFFFARQSDDLAFFCSLPYFAGGDQLPAAGILILALTCVFVYAVKLFRLYLAFSNTGLTFHAHVLQFLKTLPASLLLPFKLGDLFRAYCYGIHIQNFFRSILIILIDRFSDTLALVTILFLTVLYRSEMQIPFLLFLLIGFLMLLIICYQAFPSFAGYWKRYLLESSATKQRLEYLHLLARCEHVYHEMQDVVRGRLLLMYFLSMVAWCAESGIILYYFSLDILSYLLAGLGTAYEPVQQSFVLISVCLVLAAILVYATFRLMKMAVHS